MGTHIQMDNAWLGSVDIAINETLDSTGVQPRPLTISPN